MIKMPKRLWLLWTRKSSMADKLMWRLPDHVKKFKSNKVARVLQEEEDTSEEEEEDSMVEEEEEVDSEAEEEEEVDSVVEEEEEVDSVVEEVDSEEEEPHKDQTRESNPRLLCLLPIFPSPSMMPLSERSSPMLA